MKYLIYSFLFLRFTFSQQISIEENNNSFSVVYKIKDLNYKDSTAGRFLVREYEHSVNEYNNSAEYLPARNIIIGIPPNSKPEISVQSINNITLYKIIPKVSIDMMNNSSKTLPEELFNIKGYLWIRDIYCVHIQLNIITFNNLSLSFIEHREFKLQFKFSSKYNIAALAPISAGSEKERYLYHIILNKDMAGQFQSKAEIFSDSAGNWIDYNAAYIKYSIADDCVYRISRHDIERLGIQINNIDPRNFKMYLEGREIPLYVQGELDGNFDENDFIEFYGHKNYNKISSRVINTGHYPYNNYLDPYSDTSHYFLTWNQGTGNRIFIQDNVLQSVEDTLDYYTSFMHVEKDLYYNPLSADVVENQDPELFNLELWMAGQIGTGTYPFNFIVEDLAENKNAAVYFKLVSYASNVPYNSHNLSLAVNQSKIDSQSANRNDRILLGNVFNSTLLNEGNNYFQVKNYDNGTFPNTLHYDWYEVEYPRTLKAVDDSLTFSILDSLPRSNRFITIQNINSNDIVIYKTKPSLKKITKFNLSGTTISFTDTVGPGDNYILCPVRKLLIPSGKIKQFINLRDNSRTAEYIGITHSVFQNSASDYLSFITNHYEIKSALILTEDIYDEFSYGFPYPSSIKTFLHYAYHNWSGLKPYYLMLLGSACYDYKSNFFRKNGYQTNTNLVPSFGEPVSDIWFTIWDSTDAYIQQMMVGRIPARSDDELLFYLQKHRNYLTQRYNSWNKTAILFSGGSGNDSLQLKELKKVNDYLIQNYIEPARLSLKNNHFYKTMSPISDFGPFEYPYVRRTIEEGGVFISYIGHSGTRTWDNSINNPVQLSNIYNKHSLITDFGCSTNKFAEPDVEAFGSLFINKGEAIGYIGNSSLGFKSTTLSVPQYFYKSLLSDTNRNIAKAHYYSKMKMFENLGSSDVYRIFSLTNQLLGDPIIDLAVPDKPNLFVSGKDIKPILNNLNDGFDSMEICVQYFNYGTVDEDSFNVIIEDYYKGSINFSFNEMKVLPGFNGSIIFNIPIKNRPGIHTIRIRLDTHDKIKEMYEDDNEAENCISISSLNVRPVVYSEFMNLPDSSLLILNPTVNYNGNNKLITQYDTLSSFLDPKTITQNIDTFTTRVYFNQFENNRWYLIRSRIDNQDTSWCKTASFFSSDSKFNYYLQDVNSFSSAELKDLVYDNGIKLKKDTVTIRAESSGGDYSKYGAVLKNGINVLSNTFNWGMGIAVFDPVSLQLESAGTFWYGDDPAKADSLASYIENIPESKLVVMTAMDDAKTNLKPRLKDAIKTLGSTKVDSIGYRTPWVLIGGKGNPPGACIEAVMPRSYQDLLIIDTVLVINKSEGHLTTQPVTNSSKWKSLFIDNTQQAGSTINVQAIGIKSSGIIDTLSDLSFTNNTADLSFIDPVIYPSIILTAKLTANAEGESPVINSLGVDYSGCPELGLNFQTVTLNKDTFDIGEEADLCFAIHNAGESEAKNIDVKVEVIDLNNSRDSIFTVSVVSIAPFGKASFNIKYPIPAGENSRSFCITIDPENKNKELFKDNNIYTIPFIVLPDTNKPSLVVKFDDMEIVDGNFVSSNPEIKIELNDHSPVQFNDPGCIEVYLDNWRAASDSLNISFNNINPKASVQYHPSLTEGEHELKITARDASGNLLDSSGFRKTFTVSSRLQILYAYNYPNPARDHTYFTFRLSQIPDMLKINIYSIAGRLIKQLILPPDQLNYDFNRIYWDCRDEDGDAVSNGTYFYKIIISRGGEREMVMQRMAVTR